MYKIIEDLAHKSNYSNRPSRYAIPDTIVLHWTGASKISGSIAWCKDPAANVSAHIFIGKDGRIVRMVPDNKKAWHAGKSEWKGRKNVNSFSLGIEIVGKSSEEFTEEQYKATAWVCAEWIRLYPGITPGDITDHKTISPGRKVDVSGFDWKKFHTLLKEFREGERSEEVSVEVAEPAEPTIEPQFWRDSERASFPATLLQHEPGIAEVDSSMVDVPYEGGHQMESGKDEGFSILEFILKLFGK